MIGVRRDSRIKEGEGWVAFCDFPMPYWSGAAVAFSFSNDPNITNTYHSLKINYYLEVEEINPYKKREAGHFWARMDSNSKVSEKKLQLHHLLFSSIFHPFPNPIVIPISLFMKHTLSFKHSHLLTESQTGNSSKRTWRQHCFVEVLWVGTFGWLDLVDSSPSTLYGERSTLLLGRFERCHVSGLWY
jgi:hypothetical protein